MTAVEVLKFIGTTCKKSNGCEECVFQGNNDECMINALYLDEDAQEIIERIEKCEAEKKFKVGDWVKTNSGEVHQIMKIDKEMAPTYLLDNRMWCNACSIEHTDPPHEESKVEWVYKVNCAFQFAYVRTEFDAIKKCEEWAREYKGNPTGYRKVCRKVL